MTSPDPKAHERSNDFGRSIEAIQSEFAAPVLAVPRGVLVRGILERVHSSGQGSLAIVLGDDAVHVVRVEPAVAMMAGKQVALSHHAGMVRLELDERELSHDVLSRRARNANRRAESALSLMFESFPRNEDEAAISDRLEQALLHEQKTWIAAFGSQALRTLAIAAEERDEYGRLVNPWLAAAGAVENRVAAEWNLSPSRMGGRRPPGQEWEPLVMTRGTGSNPVRAFLHRQALRRATSEVETLRACIKRNEISAAGRVAYDYDHARELHSRLTAALWRESEAWIAAWGSPELRQFDVHYEGSSNAYELNRMRQIGAEWLAKEYPGWRFVNGYRADGHRPTLGSNGPIAPYLMNRLDGERQRIVEDAIGAAGRPLLNAQKHVDPNAELAVLAQRGAGPYVFAAVVERRLPGAWVAEPIAYVFAPQQQRELNMLLERQRGKHSAEQKQAPREARQGIAQQAAPEREAAKQSPERMDLGR